MFSQPAYDLLVCVYQRIHGASWVCDGSAVGLISVGTTLVSVGAGVTSIGVKVGVGLMSIHVGLAGGASSVEVDIGCVAVALAIG